MRSQEVICSSMTLVGVDDDVTLSGDDVTVQMMKCEWWRYEMTTHVWVPGMTSCYPGRTREQRCHSWAVWRRGAQVEQDVIMWYGDAEVRDQVEIIRDVQACRGT